MVKITSLISSLTLVAVGCAGCGIGGWPEAEILSDNRGAVLAASQENDALRTAVATAKVQFRKGNYGLAERLYRQSVEQQPNDVEAWLGLAATYDRLKRFDEADRAYEAIFKLAGKPASVLNNYGYHLMLKGQFDEAEITLRKAEELDPKNAYIRNNLNMLAQLRAGKAN